jgi:N-sulfoglucosamine sulfohydrolase
MRFAATFLLILGLVPSLGAAERPNLLVFIADDVSWNDYGCYGNGAARTPNIDRLSANGRQFQQAYLTASSCSPSRCSIITGRYPHNNGKAAELHLPIPAHLPWLPEVLREAGYYTALSGKNHMSKAAAPVTAWDHISKNAGRRAGNSGGHGDWENVVTNRPKDQPFFFWFASMDAHRAWDSDGEWDVEKYGPKHRGEDVVLSPFLVDTEGTRDDLASYYNEVTRFDHFIGRVERVLRKQDAWDDTFVLVLADNGRPFNRAKTRLHDSGMKTAMVAHWPDRIKSAGEATDSLVSVLDIAPTFLEAAGVDVPETMQGVSFLKNIEDPQAQSRSWAFSEHNWHDYEAHGRSVRGDGFLLIRNFRPELMQPGPADALRSPTYEALKVARDAKRLTPAQQDVFLMPRPEVEFYELAADPFQLTNLAGQPKFKNRQEQMHALLERWMDETRDSVPERISADRFDKETGDVIPVARSKSNAYRGTTPGEDRGAERWNAPGPR